MRILRSTEMLHPVLKECVTKIEKEIIAVHNAPMRLFETGRTNERHRSLVEKGKARSLISKHIFNLDNDPPLYSCAIEYVYYDGKWSWNLRDTTVESWYKVFGNLVLDLCPELKWMGNNRKSVNYCCFELRDEIIYENINKYPCVVY